MANRPYKVWSADRMKRKSVVVSTLEELRVKGAAALNHSHDRIARVVLEEDGTEVDDDEYFQFISNNTTFLLLLDTENWEAGSTNWCQDNVDGDSDLDMADSQQDEGDQKKDWKSVAKMLRVDLSRIITLSDDELEILTTVDNRELSQSIHCSVEDAKAIQMTCQKYLDDRAVSEDAKALLQILVNSQTEHKDNVANKRMRKT